VPDGNVQKHEIFRIKKARRSIYTKKQDKKIKKAPKSRSQFHQSFRFDKFAVANTYASRRKVTEGSLLDRWPKRAGSTSSILN